MRETDLNRLHGCMIPITPVCLVSQSCPTLCDQWTVATRLLCPRDSPDKNTGVGCHALLQGIYPTQGSKPGLLPQRQILYQLSHQGSSNHMTPWKRQDYADSEKISCQKLRDKGRNEYVEHRTLRAVKLL